MPDVLRADTAYTLSDTDWTHAFFHVDGFCCHMDTAVQGKGCLRLPTQGTPETG